MEEERGTQDQRQESENLGLPSAKRAVASAAHLPVRQERQNDEGDQQGGDTGEKLVVVHNEGSRGCHHARHDQGDEASGADLHQPEERKGHARRRRQCHKQRTAQTRVRPPGQTGPIARQQQNRQTDGAKRVDLARRRDR